MKSIQDDFALSQPFLTRSSTELDDIKQTWSYTSRIPCSGIKKFLQDSRWLCIHSLILLTYTILFALAFFSISSEKSLEPQRLHLSAQPALEWEIRKFETKTKGNPFVGEPRPELEEAWHGLLQNDNLRVSSSDFDEAMPVIKLSDGSGVIAQLTVFHALHCLKKLRQWVYRDHYYKDASEPRLALESGHADHCIEYIRENLMCKPDISLITYKWVNGTQGNGTIGESKSPLPSNKDLSEHECVNWEKLDEWAADRVFNLFRTDLLEIPEGFS